MPRGKASREAVGQAALALARREGMKAVTIRRVAREVGLESMSLYSYVGKGGDIYAAMVEQFAATNVVEALAAPGLHPEERDALRRHLILNEVHKLGTNVLALLAACRVEVPACRHIWSPLDAAPDCSGVVYECIEPGCGAESCLDEDAWADIAADDAVDIHIDQRHQRQEATHGR